MMKADDFYIQGKDSTLETLKHIAEMTGCEFYHMDMADSEFIKKTNQKFRYVYVDSEHTLEHVKLISSLLVSLDKVVDGGVVIFDDVSCYDHSIIDSYMIKNGYEKMRDTDFKVSYMCHRPLTTGAAFSYNDSEVK